MIAGALAVILILNGVQVWLPRPAFLFKGAAYVPVRPVVERLGGTVRTSANGQQVVVRGPSGAVTFQVGPPGTGSALIADGLAYVRARELAERLGGMCAWDSRSLTLNFMLPWLGADPMRTTRQAVVSDPLQWQDKLVQVSGRYGGRIGDPLQSENTRLAEGGYVLLGPFPLPCSAQDYGVVAEPSRPGPLSMLGRPVITHGMVALSPHGSTFLKVMDAPADLKAPGPGLYVNADRLECQPGDLVRLMVTVTASPGGMGPGGGHGVESLEVVAPDGTTSTVQLERITAALQGQLGSASATYCADWRLPGGSGRQGVGVWTLRFGTERLGEAAEGRFRVRVREAAGKRAADDGE